MVKPHINTPRTRWSRCNMHYDIMPQSIYAQVEDAGAPTLATVGDGVGKFRKGKREGAGSRMGVGKVKQGRGRDKSPLDSAHT